MELDVLFGVGAPEDDPVLFKVEFHIGFQDNAAREEFALGYDDSASTRGECFINRGLDGVGVQGLAVWLGSMREDIEISTEHREMKKSYPKQCDSSLHVGVSGEEILGKTFNNSKTNLSGQSVENVYDAAF